MRRLLPPLLLIICIFAVIVVADEAPQSFSFAVVGDLQQPPEGIEYKAVTHTIIGQVAQSEAAFLIIVGDLIENHGLTTDLAKKRWQAFDEAIKPVLAAGKKVYAVPGNNDFSYRASRIEFSRRFPKTYHSFAYRGTIFVLLNSEGEGTGYRDWNFGTQQTSWLTGETWKKANSNEKPLTFAFMHRPVYRSEIMKMDSSGRYGQDKPEVAKLFEKLNISAVFSGHEHLYAYRQVRGIDYYITGGGGAHLIPTGFHHFLLVKVDPAKKEYQVRVVRPQ